MKSGTVRYFVAREQAAVRAAARARESADEGAAELMQEAAVEIASANELVSEGGVVAPTHTPWPARLRAAAYTGSLGLLTLTAYAMLSRELGFHPVALVLMALLVAAPLASVECLLRVVARLRSSVMRGVALALFWPVAALPAALSLRALALDADAMATLWTYGAAVALLCAALLVLTLLSPRR